MSYHPRQLWENPVVNRSRKLLAELTSAPSDGARAELLAMCLLGLVKGHPEREAAICPRLAELRPTLDAASRWDFMPEGLAADLRFWMGRTTTFA